jgi:hypothetical protein
MEDRNNPKKLKSMTLEEKKKYYESKAKEYNLKASRLKEEERKKETHIKILYGAMLMKKIQENDKFRSVIEGYMNEFLTNPNDRKKFNYLVEKDNK